MTMPDKDSPWWPWMRMATRQIVLLASLLIYYKSGMAMPDFATMATLLLADTGMESLKAIFGKDK